MSHRPLVIAGIDEAGYGPRLGPLCVAMASMVDRAPASDGGRTGARDPWRLLRPVVGRAADKRRRALTVDDSKSLTGARGADEAAVLRRLEPAILSMLAARDVAAVHAGELFEALGADASRAAAWPPGDDLALPVSTTADHIRCLAAPLRSRLAATNLDPPVLSCRTLFERDFNNRCRELESKAEVNLELIAALLRQLAASLDGRPAVVYIDRQSGRTRYGRFLSRTFDRAVIDVLDETPKASEYLVQRTGANVGAMRVRFEVDADAVRFPVALASMTAKYIRELAMIRFNRYWCARSPGLRPTAGYGADARRWLQDVAPIITPAEREALVRRA